MNTTEAVQVVKTRGVYCKGLFQSTAGQHQDYGHLAVSSPRRLYPQREASRKRSPAPLNY